MPRTAAVIQPPTTDSYTWSFPGSPIRIHLRLDVAERLLADMRKAFGGMPPHETGGLLMGRAESPVAIQIREFQALDPDSGGANYVLSPDSETIRQARARLADKDGLAVIGYYRSHLGEDLSLNSDDLALFRAQFSKPTDVCLLVKPLPDGTATAGFFFWDNGAIESGFSFNEFPFDPEWLRMEAMEQRIAAIRRQAEEDRATEPIKPASATPRRWGRLVWSLLAIGTLAVGLGLGYSMWGRHAGWGRPYTVWTQVDAGNYGAATQLDLRIHTQGDDLRLTWNRGAPILKGQNVRGVLTIVDGDSQGREIALGPEELLTTGNIIYTPLNNKVRFRLTIESATEKMAESAFSVKAFSAKDGVVQPAQPAVVKPAPSRWQPEPASEQPAEEAKAVKTFVPPAPVQPSREQANLISEHAEPHLPVGTPANTPVAAAWAVSFNIAPPPVRQVPTDQSPISSALSTQPVGPAGESPRDVYTAAKPIRQVKPVIPAASRIIVRKDGEVKVNVYIDATGKVKRAEAVESTVPVLTGSALSAALLWRFEPAQRNGQKVESMTVLVFQFRANRPN